MSLNLSALFPSFQIHANKPEHISNELVVFQDKMTSNWITISKQEVSARDYALLAAVFDVFEFPNKQSSNPEQIEWSRYLDGQGDPPTNDTIDIRTHHLSFPNDRWELNSLSEAVEAFFGTEMILLYRTQTSAVLIEKKSSYAYTLEDFTAFTAILESDFFVKPKLFVGKFHSSNLEYPLKFKQESDCFLKGLTALPKKRIYTMELVFPSLLIDNFSPAMKELISTEVLEPIDQDSELLKTVRCFFESGFNGSTTSEKLHIHRNTLNYRLSKFQDITGISIRNFDGALLAYFASLLAAE